ncbi:MAG: hypothetical protein NTV77_01040 [Candidatus Azambacteria bacterium]|nr:hypothetical protein [Candidatus Azambacteria bacterium]
MNKDDLIKKLENLDLPEVELPSHQRRLKMALLNSGYFKKQTTMSTLKKFAPLGFVAVFALLIVVGVSYWNKPSLTPAAYAKELVAEAQKQIADIKAVAAFPDPSTGVIQWKTPDADGNIRDEKGNIIFTTTPEGELVPAPREVPAVGQTITTKDFALSLEEAYQAKDLVYLGNKVLPDGKRVRVLRFTKEGQTVILGINENNLPVVKIVYDGKTGGGIMFQQGEIKNGQPLPSEQGVQYGKIDPNAPQPKSVEEMKNFWTENLEQPTDFKAIQK